jgi:general secretion pathway protein K
VRLRAALSSKGGFALVLTLMALVIITAMVVEFAYGVFVNTNFLRNWQASERLSLVARSGALLGSELLHYASKQYSYTYPGAVDVPPGDPFAGEIGNTAGDSVALRIEDETSKFNLNSLVYSNDELHEEAFAIFKRLLSNLSLDETIADNTVDWIDNNTIPRVSGSEASAANRPLASLDELLLIPGMDQGVYDKLLPYVTVYGARNNIKININGAGLPLLAAMHEEMTGELAQRIISRRELKPFSQIDQLQGVAGFDKGLGTALIGRITVKGEVFRIVSTASSEDGIKRSIECVIDAADKIYYWKEI